MDSVDAFKTEYQERQEEAWKKFGDRVTEHKAIVKAYEDSQNFAQRK